MDALLLGRQTYDNFAGHWPAAPADIPFTGLLNGVDKYVASRKLRSKSMKSERQICRLSQGVSHKNT